MRELEIRCLKIARLGALGPGSVSGFAALAAVELWGWGDSKGLVAGAWEEKTRPKAVLEMEGKEQGISDSPTSSLRPTTHRQGNGRVLGGTLLGGSKTRKEREQCLLLSSGVGGSLSGASSSWATGSSTQGDQGNEGGLKVGAEEKRQS